MGEADRGEDAKRRAARLSGGGRCDDAAHSGLVSQTSMIMESRCSPKAIQHQIRECGVDATQTFDLRRLPSPAKKGPVIVVSVYEVNGTVG